MKKIILILIVSSILIVGFSSKEKYFEGSIVYEHKYESSNPKMNLKPMEKAYGTRSEFFYKNGNFKQIFNGTQLKLNLFLVKENKTFMQNSNDTLYYSYEKANEKVVFLETDTLKDYILGLECKILKLRSNTLDGTFHRNAEYYYNEKTKIDPKLSKNQIYGSINLIYEKTRAIPLKLVTDYGDMKITMTAIEIKPKKIEDSFFEIAKNALVAPWRY